MRRSCRCRITLASILFAATHVVGAQSLTDWTDGPGTLGLGYPVPIPVDTPLPFDGFRTYAGLHAQHQSLDVAHEALSGEVIGQTRLGRDIWLYSFGEPGSLDREGRVRPAILVNGGIHAREWQSPEVVTGLMELLAAGEDDGHWLSYLRDNVSILMIPVLNIDGFLQTQRYPRSNYLGSDPEFPSGSPRDGRMRRKNHFEADEDLLTVGDHLRGVDLNRNNAPFWPGPPSNMSPLALVYRGTSAGSEPEIQALQAAGQRVPPQALRFYSDMHSFGRVFFAVDTGNSRRLFNQNNVLSMAIQHHRNLPGTKVYTLVPEGPSTGIGTTSEYFAYTYQVPSLTWELEPGGMGAVEYGGFGSNGHDGFILPESEIRRVRENTALTLAAVAYHMAGPAHLQAVRIFDADDDALLFDSRWRLDGSARGQERRTPFELELGRTYRVWLAFSKPMRWRDGEGAVVPFPGQQAANLDLGIALQAAGADLSIESSSPSWLGVGRDGAPGSWRYRDDAALIDITVQDTSENRTAIEQAIADGSGVHLVIDARDMTGRRIDGDPSTPIDFVQGAWTGYENGSGVAGDIGGADRTQIVPLSTSAQAPALPVDPGHSATWYDPARDGEGFVLENLDGVNALVYWFTYDEDGGQRWLTGLGTIAGNRIVIPELVLTTGGRFGPPFDPDAVVRQAVGSGEFWFTGCDEGWFDYEAFGQHGRFALRRTSRTMTVDCDPATGPGQPEAAQSGSWYDPTHDGEGYALQWMTNGNVIMTWYSFDPEGRPYWMLGVGIPEGDEIVFPDMHATRGARFGADFDPGEVERFLWGEVRLRLQCGEGEADYASVLPAFGSGSFQLQRLTGLAGLSCLDE